MDTGSDFVYMPLLDRSKILKLAEELPPTPQILSKIQSCMQNPDSDLNDLVKLIRMDATLAAQVVRLSNSSFYGSSIPSENIMEAVQRLGFREVHRLVGLVAAKQFMGAAAPVYKLKAGELWEISIIRAVMLETFAKAVGVNHDTAYTIGLLHGIGKVVVNQFTLEAGLSFYDEVEDGQVSPELEQRILGMHFGDIGGVLMECWKFTQEVILPVRFQESPFDASDQRVMTCLLYLSTHLGDQWRAEGEADPFLVEDVEQIYEITALKENDIPSILETTAERIEKIKSEFNF